MTHQPHHQEARRADVGSGTHPSSPTHEHTTQKLGTSPAQEARWQALEQSRGLLAVAVSLQDELSELHASLGALYHPSLEERAHRLTIERDEALVSWGKAILGLKALDVTLKLHLPHDEAPPVQACGVLSEALHSAHLNTHAEERVLGMPSLPTSGEVFEHLKEPEGLKKPEEPEELKEIEEPEERQLEVLEGAEEEEGEEGEEGEDVDGPGVAEVRHLTFTPDDLEHLQHRLQQKGWPSEEEEHSPREAGGDTWKEEARTLALRIGAPKQSYDSAALKQSLLELEGEVECCQQWSLFGREVQNALISLITSRLRKHQRHLGDNLFDQDRVAKLFRRLTRYSSDFRPGFVQALSREKTPSGKTWEEDERAAWLKLEELLEIKAPLPRLSADQEEAIEELRALTESGGTKQGFEQALRSAVTACLNAGLPYDSPHLTDHVRPHIKLLSGKRFKQLRQAQAQLG